MKYKNIFNYILSIICFISWSNLTMAQNKGQNTTPIVATKTVAQCDLQKIVNESESLKTEHTKKLQSFDPKSKTVKNKIIGDGVATNIFLVKLLAAQTGCKNTTDKEKQWVNSEIEKNTKQLKIYTNSYCKSVIMPGNDQSKNSVETGELGPDKDGGCKSNAERRMVNFVFNVCTPGSADYDLKLCECHVQDRGNSCLYEKEASQKLIKKIEAVTEDKICDEPTPQSKNSMFDNKNLVELLKLAALVAVIAGGGYLIYKNMKKSNSKNTDAIAAGGGGTTAGGTTSGGLPKSFKGRYAGNVDMSNHEERIAARNIALREMGKPITGNDEIDNAATGGGPPDGGIYMAGTFDFTVDANNNVVPGGTFTIHGWPLKLGGGKINSDGSFNINPEGLEVKGQLNGTSISGIANEYGKPHVFGRLNGTFTPQK